MEETRRKATCSVSKTSPRIRIKDIDKEAPTDEWGFPAVAGKLTQSGGACASGREVEQHISQEPEPDGLINKLLAVDVVDDQVTGRI